MSSSSEKSFPQKLGGELKESHPNAPARVADEEPIEHWTRPRLRADAALWILSLIALVVALHLAQTFFVPLLFGILVSNALSPAMDWFERSYSARTVGGTRARRSRWRYFMVVLSLSDDEGFMLEKLPDAARKLRQSLRTLHAEGPSILEQIQKAVKELEKAAPMPD